MMYKDTQGYRDYRRHIAGRMRISRIRRRFRTAYEGQIAVTIKRIPKAYYNYLQSRAALPKAVGGGKNHQGIVSADSNEKADCLLKFFQEAFEKMTNT